jgi:hypothetical protein
MIEIIYHTIRATIRVWLAIPFYILSGVLYYPAMWLGCVANILTNDGRIPFNPIHIYKNVKRNTRNDKQ